MAHDHEHHEHGRTRDEIEHDVHLPSPSAGRRTPDIEPDPAHQSLADALRVSFRLLSVIMVFVVIAFLLTGFKSIESRQVGVRKVFGRTVGTSEEGLAYTWPFPVGQIEVVNIAERSLPINAFWMEETAAEATMELTERTPPEGGLRPGRDGALLTGDRNLLHVKLTCQYRINGPRGAEVFLRTLGRPGDGIEQDFPDGAGSNLEEAVYNVVCEATIQAAADRTADGIRRGRQAQFLSQVRDLAQEKLNELTPNEQGDPYPAIRIDTIVLDNITWPLRALPAYLAAQRSVSQREQLRSDALQEAQGVLNAAAGGVYRMLVGEPETFVGVEAGEPRGLIARYDAAENPQQAVEIRREIERVLNAPQAGGEAAKALAEARGYRTQVIQTAQSRAKRFEDLLGQYSRTPQFMMERLWADTRDAILNSPTVEKVYVTTGTERVVYRINRPPEVARQIRRARLEETHDEDQQDVQP